jgi:hypothetical protein
VPFKSRKQQAYLFSQKPKVAKQFAAETSPAQFKALPVRVPKPRLGAKRALPARGGTR